MGGIGKEIANFFHGPLDSPHGDLVYYTASSHGKGERNANQGMKGSQEMSKTNLKPCPKCGGNATVIWEEGENYIYKE